MIETIINIGQDNFIRRLRGRRGGERGSLFSLGWLYSSRLFILFTILDALKVMKDSLEYITMSEKAIHLR